MLRNGVKHIVKKQNTQVVCMKIIFICQQVLLERKLIMGKGSSRRVEDTEKIESNPFWENTTFAKKQREKDANKSKHTDKKKTD